jgi:DNA repair exonuclease SbcCD ATPase subunit
MDTELIEKQKRFTLNFTRLQTYCDVLKRRIASLEKDKEDACYQVDLHQKCSEIFKKWLDDSLEKNTDAMADLATTALRHTIHDQQLTFRVKQEPKYNRVAIRFVLEEESPRGIVEGDPINSYGGGAAAVISLVLRLAVMARMGMGNLLLLDESMHFVSNAYVPGAAMFMRKLAERTGVNILMVTHNSEFITHAHTAYEGHKDGCLKLRKIRTECL